MMKYIGENGGGGMLTIKIQAPFLQWATNNFLTFYKLQTILHVIHPKGMP